MGTWGYIRSQRNILGKLSLKLASQAGDKNLRTPTAHFLRRQHLALRG
jgi:hypothetical protein